MNVFLIIGGAGMGKSPFVQEFIKDRRCFVFDVQNEYGRARAKYPNRPKMNLSDNVNDLRARYTGKDFRRFLTLCESKRNTVCVIEEATIFLRGQIEEAATAVLVGRYHTGNNYLLLFHSINSVPPRPYELCSHIVLFKTNDDRGHVKKKFPKLLPYYDDLQTRPNGDLHVIEMQPQPKQPTPYVNKIQ